MPSPQPAPLACSSCGYSLGELDGGQACPECGTPVSLTDLLSTRRFPPGPAARQIARGYAWVAGVALVGLVALLVLVGALVSRPSLPDAVLASFVAIFGAAAWANASAWRLIAKGLALAAAEAGRLGPGSLSARAGHQAAKTIVALNAMQGSYALALAIGLLTLGGLRGEIVPMALGLCGAFHLLKGAMACNTLHQVAARFGPAFDRSPWLVVAASCVGVLLAACVPVLLDLVSPGAGDAWGRFLAPPLLGLGWAFYGLRAARMALGLRAYAARAN